MRIALVSHYYDAELASPDALIDRYLVLSGAAQALAEAGNDVSVMQRFHTDAKRKVSGVNYSFIADGLPPSLSRWQRARAFHEAVAGNNPEVMHVHSLHCALQAWDLRRRSPMAAILIQDHAGLPTRGWYRHVQRQLLRAADGFLFAAPELGAAWVQAGIIASTRLIHTVMEGSTRFAPADRTGARSRTQVRGDPVFVWVGRLNANKDPLCTLRGFERSLQQLPKAHLYMIYHEEDIEKEVIAQIEASDTLASAVTLVGEVAHQDLQDYFSSADYFLLGSHKEGSGFALCEALACGLVPIVTDIPSFRMMTDNGRFGGLWGAGDADSCTAAILAVTAQPHDDQSRRALAFFHDALSFAAIGRQSEAIYRQAVADRSNRLDTPR